MRSVRKETLTKPRAHEDGAAGLEKSSEAMSMWVEKARKFSK